MFGGLSLRYSRSNADEYALTTAEEQIAKHWPASVIDTGNLPIEDGTFNVKMFRDPGGEIRKAAEGVSISGN